MSVRVQCINIYVRVSHVQWEEDEKKVHPITKAPRDRASVHWPTSRECDNVLPRITTRKARNVMREVF